MRNPRNSSSRLYRNVMERSRRMQMKDLLSNLSSSMQIKPQERKLPLLALLEKTTSYIEELKVKVERMKESKVIHKAKITGEEKAVANIVLVPVVEVKEMGSTMVVNLITGLDKSIMLHQISNVLQEEGAEVMTATYSTVGHGIFYTIHFQALSSRLGIEVSRVQQRLMQLVIST